MLQEKQHITQSAFQSLFFTKLIYNLWFEEELSQSDLDELLIRLLR